MGSNELGARLRNKMFFIKEILDDLKAEIEDKRQEAIDFVCEPLKHLDGVTPCSF
jgi:hypothetical protein